MPYFRLLIGPYPASVDYSGATDFPSWAFYQSLQQQGSYATGSVVIADKALPRPKAKNEIRVLYPDGSTLFGGIVQEVEQVGTGNPTVFEYRLHCSDYTRWLDHVPIGQKLYAGQVSDIAVGIVTDWVSTSAYSADFGHVGPSAPITTNHCKAPLVDEVNVGYAYDPSWQLPSEAIDFLAKTFNAVWFIDPDRDLWFYYPDGSPYQFAPLPGTHDITYYTQDPFSPATAVVTGMPCIQWDTDTPDGGTDAAFNLSITESIPNGISAVRMRDYLELSSTPFTQTFAGNGSQTFFPLDHQPADPAHTAVTVNGVPYLATNAAGSKALLTEYVDGQPTDATPGDNCYVCRDNSGLRFGTPPPAGQAVQVTYNYFFPNQSGLIAAALAAEIAAREGFGPGYYYETASGAALTAPISVAEGDPPWLAEMKLTLFRYARIKILAKFDSYLTGWRPGQIFGLYSPKRGDATDNAFTGWSTDAQFRLIVTQVETRIIGDGRVRCSIDAASDIWSR